MLPQSIKAYSYSPYKATQLADGDWNRRPNRVKLTFGGLRLMSKPCKRLVLKLHFPFSSMAEFHVPDINIEFTAGQ